MIKVRFAPSPTGRLHVGNIFVAVQNWLFAKSQGGKFVLRLDDTDRERSREELAEAIQEDLTWLGLVWDEFDRQSLRITSYDQAAEKLKKSGRLYPCYESAEELSLKRKTQLSQGKPPVYDRAALKLSPEERAALEAKGQKPHWRFLLEGRDVSWNDLVRGPQHIDERSQSDPILIREDGSYLYTLPSIVDDIDMGISHVIRGNDHVTNTATQIQIFEALGAKAPDFAHLPLVTDASGEGLSKRLGSLSIGEMRKDGFDPLAITAYLAKIGTGDPVEAISEMQELFAHFNIGKFGKGSPRFDPVELLHLNAKLLHKMPYEMALKRAADMGISHFSSSLWEAAKDNLEKISDIQSWQKVLSETMSPVVSDPDYLKEALNLLPKAPWDQTSWGIWTSALKDKTGRKGKDLFLPLRLALTGTDHGPEMKVLLPLLTPDIVQARLMGKNA